MSEIFISYRRGDSADVTGRINDRLIAHFGEDAIFIDVDKIPLGVDFYEHIDNVVAQCVVELVIIGSQWLDAKDRDGRRRLDHSADYVRLEVEAALSRNIPVIPVLVHGANMPSADQLPFSMSKLAYRNGIPVRSDPDFHRDMDRLIKALDSYIKSRVKLVEKERATGSILKRDKVAEVHVSEISESPEVSGKSTLRDQSDNIPVHAIESNALVIEENPAWQEIITEMLNGIGLSTTSVTSSLQAFEVLRLYSYALIILALNLSHFDSGDSAMLYQANRLGVPVIVITINAGLLDLEVEPYRVFALMEKQTFDRETFMHIVHDALQTL